MKNGYREDDTWFTLLVKLKRVIFIMKVLTLKLIEVKRKVSSKRVLLLFFTFFRLMKHVLDDALG